MVQIFPDEGLQVWFDRLVADGVLCHLFVNDVAPSRDTLLGDLVEAAWGGYSHVAINAIDWNVLGIFNHRLKALAPLEIPVGFGVTPTYYGYYLTSLAGGELLAVARYDGAPITGTTSENVAVTPLLGDFSGSF